MDTDLLERARMGDADAQCKLGYNYCFEGDGFPRDIKMSLLWYRKAADQGYAKAQYKLGLIYESLYKSYDLPQNYEEATKWYRKAAEQGLATAQTSLGECYEYGNGVEQDYAEAVKWYRKAAEQRYGFALFKLGECYEYGKGVPQDYKEATKYYIKTRSSSALERLDKLYEKGKIKRKYTFETENKIFPKIVPQGLSYDKSFIVLMVLVIVIGGVLIFKMLS